METSTKIILLIIAIGVPLALIYAVFTLFKRYRHQIESFDLISMAVIVLVFAQTYNFVILKLLHFIFRFSNGIFIMVYHGKDQYAEHLFNFFKEFNDTYLQNFPLAVFMVSLALWWVLRGILSSYLIFEEYSKDKLHKRKMFLTNAFILCTLGSSLIIVLSVLISIPYLQKGVKKSTRMRSSLEESLKGIRKSIPDSTKYHIVCKYTTINVDEELRKDTVGKLINTNKTLQALLQKDITFLKETIKADTQNRKAVIEAYNEKVNEFYFKSNSFLSEMTNTLPSDSNATSLIDFERYRNDAIRAYSRYITDVAMEFDNVKMKVADFDRRKGENYLKAYKDIIGNCKDSSLYRLNAISYLVPDNSLSLVNNTLPYLIDYSDMMPPQYTLDGRDWGFLGSIATPLIMTNSIDLVLLVGMIGFGLFGASISSFAKFDTPPAPEGGLIAMLTDNPVVQNFGEVIVRGLSAAILIYLTSKGGIVVLTGDTNATANGYILLFTCFVGSVYSSKIWEKAKESLK